MNCTLKHSIDRVIASMPVVMILIAGTLAKTGRPDWGLAWIAGLCALLFAADLFDPHGQHQTPV
jgi:type IV secretory pathway VirB2 component (pilin)